MNLDKETNFLKKLSMRVYSPEEKESNLSRSGISHTFLHAECRYCYTYHKVGNDGRPIVEKCIPQYPQRGRVICPECDENIGYGVYSRKSGYSFKIRILKHKEYPSSKKLCGGSLKILEVLDDQGLPIICQ